MKKIIGFAGIVLIGVGLTSCASSIENLQKATASNISGVSSSDVAVTGVDRGATSVSWVAAAKGQNYKCEADDMVRKVNCIKS